MYRQWWSIFSIFRDGIYFYILLVCFLLVILRCLKLLQFSTPTALVFCFLGFFLRVFKIFISGAITFLFSWLFPVTQWVGELSVEVTWGASPWNTKLMSGTWEKECFLLGEKTEKRRPIILEKTDNLQKSDFPLTKCKPSNFRQESCSCKTDTNVVQLLCKASISQFPLLS